MKVYENMHEYGMNAKGKPLLHISNAKPFDSKRNLEFQERCKNL